MKLHTEGKMEESERSYQGIKREILFRENANTTLGEPFLYLIGRLQAEKGPCKRRGEKIFRSKVGMTQ